MTAPVFDVHVRVPASSGNVGPGFDSVGLALELYSEVRLIGRRSGPALTIVNRGEGSESLPTDKRHLVFQAVRKAFQAAKRALPASVELTVVNRIPLSRGLGSSSSAIVGGLAAANEAMHRPLSRERMLVLAYKMEGHPDNAAPAIFGGLTVSAVEGDHVASVSWKGRTVFSGLVFVAAVPNFELSTAKSRAVLPARLTRADAVFNVGRAALFLAALREGRPDLFKTALDDRLHQPWRKALIPGFDAVRSGAIRAGAYGAFLSGAGPTIMAVAPASRAARVGRAMSRAFASHRITCRIMPLGVDLDGVRSVR